MDLTDARQTSAGGETVRAHLVGGPDDRESVGIAGWLSGEGFAISRGLAPRDRSPGAEGGSRADAGHVPASIPRSARWLVQSPTVAPEHSDRLVALRRGIESIGTPELIHGLLSTRSGIAVAGRKLGRFAAAILGWTMVRAGLDPTVVLRDEVPQLGGAGRAGAGRHAVVDINGVLDPILAGPPGPETAVILDVAGLPPDATAALGAIAREVGGHLLTLDGVRTDSTPSRSRFDEAFSLDRGSIWWAADLREERGRFRFRAFYRGRYTAEVRLRSPGRGSVLGALAALAVGLRAGLPTQTIVPALEDFAGVARGFQSRGSFRGVTLLDDDSTDPEGVAEAIGLARSAHARQTLWVAFAPAGPAHAVTALALAGADRLLILGAPVDTSGWEGMLEGEGASALLARDLGEALGHLDGNLEPGDVLLTLGAGDVGTIADAFLRRLARGRQGR